MSRVPDMPFASLSSSKVVRARICIMSRIPQPGVSKTRMIPALGEVGAAELQRAMTEHVVRESRIAAGLPLASRPTRTVVELEARTTGGSPGQAASWLGVRSVDQGPGDLGDRLGRALIDGAEHHDVVAVIGADCPSVTGWDLNRLLVGALAQGVSIIPAEDGGYCALALAAGCREVVGAITRDIPWGGPRVCASTIERLRGIGIEPLILPSRFDVDVEADLPRWQRLSEKWSSAPEKISVIIPVLDEVESIGGIVRSVLLESDVECVVVDGGSIDATVDQARAAGAQTVIVSARGRALQMNAGAQVATGQVLLFLHADTTLPSGWASAVRDTVRRFSEGNHGLGLGAFTFALDDSRLIFRIIEAFTRLRGRMLSLPYGDQALFVSRALFESMGGFPVYPVMEDYEFVDRARKLGGVRIVEARAVTSARAWRSEGAVSRALRNMRTIVKYRRGSSPDHLARWRAGGSCRTQSNR